MELNYYFPTVIGRSYEHKLRDKLFPIVKKILTDEDLLTNPWGYANTYRGPHKKGLERFPEFEEFSNFLVKKSYEYLKQIGYKPLVKLKPNIFASGIGYGEFHGRHCHPMTTLTGVFYLDCPEGSSDCIFYDSRTFHDSRTTLLPVENDKHSQRQFSIPAENGLFLMWESWLHHEVPVNKSISPRTTLVFHMRD